MAKVSKARVKKDIQVIGKILELGWLTDSVRTYLKAYKDQLVDVYFDGKETIDGGKK